LKQITALAYRPVSWHQCKQTCHKMRYVTL